MENNMDSAHILLPRVRLRKVSGKMVKESGGLLVEEIKMEILTMITIKLITLSEIVN